MLKHYLILLVFLLGLIVVPSKGFACTNNERSEISICSETQTSTTNSVNNCCSNHDKNLNCKNITCYKTVTSSFIITKKVHLNFLNLNFTKVKHPFIFNDPYRSTNFSKIWQPPKISIS